MIICDSVLFDLDGTLTDPFEGITNSVAYALNKFGIDVSDRRSLTPFIGPPLRESFSVFYGFSKKDAEKAVSYYREYYAETGIFENTVYDGIKDVLAELKARGKKLVVATSKPEIFAKRILEHFSLGYFDFVAGATLDSARVTKSDVISYALREGGINDRSRTVMVGDRKHDVYGAKQNGIRCIGVLYGYGNKEELIQAGADYLIAEPSDILSVGMLARRE